MNAVRARSRVAHQERHHRRASSRRFRARDLWRKMADAAWQCGDPGMQFDTTINDWHTCKNSGRINASNPCSEYMFLDDSACNLASLNLRKFQNERRRASTSRRSSAPSRSRSWRRRSSSTTRSTRRRRSRENSHAFRPLGLGYANLGALLMSLGLPYDSRSGSRLRRRDHRRSCAARPTPTSAKIARDVTGPFDGYPANKEPFLGVMRKHRRHVEKIDGAFVPYDLMTAARESWDDDDQGRPRVRLPQRPGHGARADRHDRLHDGLRHHRHRARHRARQVQAPRRRRHAQDRQQDGPRGAGAARLRRRRGRSRSSTTSTRRTRSRARRASRTSTCRCSTARSARRTARGRSTTWATSG